MGNIVIFCLLLACLPHLAKCMATKDELRPGYGIKYSHVGKMIQGLSRYDLVVGISLPERWGDLTPIGPVLPKAFSNFCTRINNLTVAYEVCLEIVPVLEEYGSQESAYMDRISQKLEYDLVAILPDLDKRNHIDNATKREGKTYFHFPITEQTNYERRHKDKVNLPREVNTDRNGLTDVKGQVEKGLGNVHRLLDGIERRLQLHDQRARQERQEAQARQESEDRQEHIQDSVLRNSQFGGKRKRSLNDGWESLSETTTSQTPPPPKQTQDTDTHTRQRRGTASKIASKIVEKVTLEGLAGLVIDGIGSFINYRKDKAIQKGINALLSRQDDLQNKIIQVDNDLLSVARTTAEAIRNVWEKIVRQNAKISLLGRQLVQITQEFDYFDERLDDQEHAIHLLSWAFGTLQTMLQRNLDHYDQLESKAEILFNALDSLSTGRLTHHVISASNLTEYLKHIETIVQKEYPGYELAIKELNKYYDMNMVSFVTQKSILYIHIPVFLKMTQQPVLDLFRVESQPIPYDPAETEANEQGEWIGSYTHVQIEKEYMAMGQEVYLDFEQKELDNCKRLGGVYYCENLLLMKHISQHTCASAIYHNHFALVKDICSVNYLEGYRPKPKFLEGTEFIMLIAMPVPWNLYCNKALDIPVQLKESSLAIISRQDLCHCAFSAGPYYIHENLLACEEQKDKLASQVGLYYTINSATTDFFGPVIAEINKTGNEVILNLDKKINEIKMSHTKLHKQKVGNIPLTGNLLTDEQIDLTAPDWQFLQSDAEFQYLQKEQATVVKDLATMVRQAEAGQLKIQQPYAKQAELKRAMTKIDKWIKAEGVWTYLLLGLAIAGTIAFLCSICLCKYFKSMKQKQTSMNTQMRCMNEGINNPALDPSTLATSLIAMTNLGKTDALEVEFSKLDVPSETMTANILIAFLDVVYFILMHVGVVILLYLILKLTACIISLMLKGYLNNNWQCKSTLCSIWTDQSDLYLQVSANTCATSLKCYIGTFLGPPSECMIRNPLQANQVRLNKGWINDKLQINWGQNNSTSVYFQRQDFYLPDSITIPLTNKLLARHLFNKKAHLTLALAIIYKNELIIGTLETAQVSKSDSIKTDIESGLATTEIAQKPLKASAPPEGGENEDTMSNFERKEANRKSNRILKVKCVHCEGDTYVNKESKSTKL